jgi:PRTRC genetic system protein C
MGVEVEVIRRIFKHGTIELVDPGVEMTKEEVLDFYSNQYPELTNASVTGPKIENDKQAFIFSTSVGTKG